ncbi:uncharacterized protein PRCAT00003225001 [Priceomyces carsonii]|uniref:uncharacterized protein n=1 Tax=Priceomyces carsonii TaxID=28549 RepID=UPI002ED8C6F6|nr:unnamed protein product [Priceomyces carsonii]
MINIFKLRPKGRIRCRGFLVKNQKATPYSIAFQRYIGDKSVKFFSENGINEPIFNNFDDVTSIKNQLGEFIADRSARRWSFDNSNGSHISQSDNVIPSFDPVSNLKDAIDMNAMSPPTVGSLVEFIDPITGYVSLGVVLRASEAKFDENYNKLTTLTMQNEIQLVSPTRVTFHLYRVYGEDWVNYSEILKYRSEKTNIVRLSLVNSLNSFMSQSKRLSLELQKNFEILFAQYAQPFSITPISLAEIIDSLKFDSRIWDDLNKTYSNQSSLLLSCQLLIRESPRWIMSSNLCGVSYTNLFKGGYSNLLPPDISYFVNSENNWSSIEKILKDFESPKKVAEYEDFLNDLLSTQESESAKSFEELNLFFNIWGGRPFKCLIDYLKFAIIYPHPSIIGPLSKLAVFKGTLITSLSIFKVLKKLKIYDNSNNQSTDVYLSSNIIGKPHLSQLAISSARELTPNSLAKDLLYEDKVVDKFPHLRNEKKYYQDHIIYGLPFFKPFASKKKSSKIAVSLERLNSRKYSINIHMPDIVTKIAPTSELFNSMSSNSSLMKTISGLINETSINILDNSLVKEFELPEQHIHDSNEIFQVGDFKTASSSKSHLKTTCLTLSFTYNVYDSNPFKDLKDNISFSFDSLHDVKIKNVDWNELDDCLNGKLEKSPFKLFRRDSTKLKSDHEKAKPSLSGVDCHNINFIYNVMRSHFKIRNLDGSSSTESSLPYERSDASNLLKKVSICDRDTPKETIISKVEVSSSNSEFNSSKFLMREIDYFIGNATAAYSIHNGIPMFRHFQDVLMSNRNAVSQDSLTEFNDKDLEPDSDFDSVFVSHNNFLLPNFRSGSYFHTLISRDSSGFVSDLAYFIGRNYLAKPEVDVFGLSSLQNIPLGMKDGYVKMCDITNDYEAMLNQIQILNYLQSLWVKRNTNTISNIHKRVSYLKRFGYNLNGPFLGQLLHNQIDKIRNAQSLIENLGFLNKRFWTYTSLEQIINENDPTVSVKASYECVVTEVGLEISYLNKKLSRAFCKDLGLEVGILLPSCSITSIGTVIQCDKIVFLDVPGGECVLASSDIMH